MPPPRKPASPFRSFNSSPEVIRLAVLMYVKYPRSLRNVEGLRHERGNNISYETVRYLWNCFGPLFAGDIRRPRASHMRGFFGQPATITTDGLRSCKAAMTELGNSAKQEIGRWAIVGWRTATCRSGDENERCCGSDR